MPCKVEDAIRIEKYNPPGGGGSKNVLIFLCQNCKTNEFRIKAKSRLKTCSGLCVKCNNDVQRDKGLNRRRLRPFEALFKRCKESAKKRNISFTLSFSEFKEILNDKCHYCHSKLLRKKY